MWNVHLSTLLCWIFSSIPTPREKTAALADTLLSGKSLAATHKPFLWQTNAAQDVPWANPQPQHRLSTSVVKWIWLPAELQWCAQGTCYSFYKEMCPNSQKLSKALEARMCRGWMMLSIHRTAWREVRLLKALFPNLLTLLKINYLSPFTCNSLQL